MPEFETANSLSFGDALFLYLERDGMPLHIASVSIFEGAISLPVFSRFIEAKLPLVPRYRQRVVTPPWNLGLPAWEYDPTFQLANHVREIKLKRGSELDLQNAAAGVLSANMDRRRPLWDFTLVRGLQGNRTGLITRVHHCLADGLAGIGLMNALLGPTPVAERLRRARRVPQPPQQPAPAALLDTVITSAFSALQRVLAAHSEFLSLGERLFAVSGNGAQPASMLPANGASEPVASVLDVLRRVVPDLAAPVQRLSFNIICRGPQKFHWAQVPLDEIKAIKNALGVTVNDVALATIAMATRRYAELHGQARQGRMLRIVVPVSIRARNEMRELGNRITFLPVSVPLDVRRPRDLVAAVSEKMELLKTSHVAELVGFVGTMFGAAPTVVPALLGSLVSQLPISLCNLIFTNVRGPATPLYLLGHKMLACYPYVPIGGEMGMNCAVLTYEGTAYFGFTGDANAVPDLRRFEKLMTASFAELRKAAGVKPSMPKRHRPKPKPKPRVEAAATPPHPATVPAGVPGPVPETPVPPKPLTKAAVA